MVELGLTLLAQENLSLKFWPGSFSTVVYLINRFPTKVLKDKIPMEKLFKVKHEYQSLKTFD